MEINERIRSLRISKKLTQRDVALYTGVTEMSVRCWESGSKNPSMQAIILLSKLYGVSADFLLGVEEKDITLPCDKQEAKLLEDYRALDEHGKSVVAAVCALEKARIDKTNREKK